MRTIAAVLWMMTAAGSSAHAEGPAEPIDGAKLDVEGRAAVGIDLRYLSSGAAYIEALAFELHGRIPFATRFMLELRVPAFAAGLDGQSLGRGIGNVQLGARWVPPPRAVEDGEYRLGVEVHVGLPTAPGDGDPGLGAFVTALLFQSLDIARYLPETTQIGVQISPRFTGGRFFIQLDASLDILITAGESVGVHRVLRANLGIGVAVVDRLTLMTSLQGGLLGGGGIDDGALGLTSGAS